MPIHQFNCQVKPRMVLLTLCMDNSCKHNQKGGKRSSNDKGSGHVEISVSTAMPAQAYLWLFIHEKQKWQNHDPILGMDKKMAYFRIILGIMFSPARKLYMIEPVNALNKLEISTRVSWYHGGR